MMPFLMGPLMIIGSTSPAMQESIQQMSMTELAVMEGGMLLLSLIMVTIGMTLVTAFLIHRYASAMVLRTARARVVGREQELELHRVVENLCIGAGLPKPRLCVIESSTPNAFATGRDSEDASIAVTRGLLTLLDRRELEGVIAHELSHIGNQDIRLSTMLTGLIGTMTIPLTLITAIFRPHWIIGAFVILMLAPIIGSVLLIVPVLFSKEFRELPPVLVWWTFHAIAAPFYFIFVAPFVGRFIQRAVSREREFLADADAVLLTRNPEALATALVKIGSAMGTPIRVGPATAHLYFVDPVSGKASWLTKLFRSHPPIEERLDLLARLGSGILPSAFAEARRAGAENRARARLAAEAARSERKPFPTPAMAFSDTRETASLNAATAGSGESAQSTPGSEGQESGSTGTGWTSERKLADARIVLASDAQLDQRFHLGEEDVPLYEHADGWSRVLLQLTPGVVVTARDREKGFLRVSTGDDIVGYLGRNTRLVVMGDEEGV
jgi:heat shock protein HtpX